MGVIYWFRLQIVGESFGLSEGLQFLFGLGEILRFFLGFFLGFQVCRSIVEEGIEVIISFLLGSQVVVGVLVFWFLGVSRVSINFFNFQGVILQVGV